MIENLIKSELQILMSKINLILKKCTTGLFIEKLLTLIHYEENNYNWNRLKGKNIKIEFFYVLRHLLHVIIT